jgi:hypothetical protein
MISFALLTAIKRSCFLPELITQPKVVNSSDKRQSDHQHKGNDDIITNHKFVSVSVALANGDFTHLKPDSLLLHTLFSFCCAIRVHVPKRRESTLTHLANDDVEMHARNFMFRRRLDLFRCFLSAMWMRTSRGLR